MKTILGVYSSPKPHWVGDGFPVRTMFTYQQLSRQMSPFLMLDYAGPAVFRSAEQHRGVGQHPHRGFETVTIVYQGELEHHDSTGAGGRIGPGDVQWMTAGSGILHEEYHSEEFTRGGGTLEMVQLWVNLPARDKMAPPGYQTIVDADIPASQSATMIHFPRGRTGGHRRRACWRPARYWQLCRRRIGESNRRSLFCQWLAVRQRPFGNRRQCYPTTVRSRGPARRGFYSFIHSACTWIRNMANRICGFQAS